MSPIVPMLSESARKTHSALLQALARVGLEPVARQLGVSGSTVSRMKKDDGANDWDMKLSQVAQLLDAMGMKAVPKESKCYHPEKLAWLIQGAREYAARLKSADDLLWEEAE